MDRKDYMGVLVVNHYVSPTPLSCYGSQMPVKAITEIAIYTGGYDEKGAIVKGEQLAKIRLSELQFGRLIARPNCSGHSATLEYLQGFDVNQSHLENNPDEMRLQRIIEKSARKDNQTSRFIREIEEIIQESKEKKRVVKKKQLLHLLELIQSNAPSNFRYGLRRVGEVGEKRVIEAKSQIHNLIRNAYRVSKNPLAIENKSIKSEETLSCLASASIVHNAGQSKLFDTVGDTFESVSLEINADNEDVVAQKVREIENESGDMVSDNLYLHRRVAEISMSLDQYARFVRADNTEIPCTIHRVGYFTAKDQVVADKRESLMGDLKKDGNEILTDLLLAANKASTLIKESGARSASDRDNLIDICLSLSDIYDGVEGKIKQHSDKITHGVMSAYQEEINQYKDDEVAQLPPSDRQAIKKLLGDK